MTSLHTFTLALLASVGLAFTGAVAQTAPPAPAAETKTQTQTQTQAQTTGNDIVVNGKPVPKPAIVRHQAQAISEATDRLDTSLARFPAPVCPAVFGLSPALNPLIAARLRKDAVAAGMSVAHGKCDANAIVVFVPNGQAEIKALSKTRPALFGGLSDDELRALSDDPGPVHVWRRIGVHGREGDTLDSAGGTQNPTLKVEWPSHLALSTQLAIEGAIIVIDQPAASGKTVAQLADYAAIRLFAETRPPAGDAAVDTILTLFDPAPASHVASLTRFDLAYLKSVYRAPSGQPAFSTLGAVGGTYKKDDAAAKR